MGATVGRWTMLQPLKLEAAGWNPGSVRKGIKLKTTAT